MASRRYTILIADRTSGVVRRVTISARPAVAVACAMVTLPVLIGVGAAWKAKSDVAGLYFNQQALELENSSYRTATSELSGQIESLQSAISDLGAQAALDPTLARTMEKLPALVKSRAMGGNVTPTERSKQQDSTYARTLSALSNPEDTFGLLRSLLEGLESRLQSVRTNVEKRNALADATPSIWPAHGWLTSRMGPRTDPVTGGADYHNGLDIAGDKGQPVYVTAAGVVTQAGYLAWVGVACVMLSVLLERRTQLASRLAADRSRLLTDALEAEQRERKALAEALHDHAIQNLLSARHELEEAAETTFHPALGRAEDALVAAAGQLREAVFDLHPYVLEAAGLEAALRSIAQEAASRGHFGLRLDLNGPGPHAHDQLVFSAARELLTNVVRHADATLVGVRLAERDGELVLVVEDDGCGFPAERVEERLADGHIGLAAQRVRVEAAGGHMELLSTPGDGTRVEVRVPDRAGGNGRVGG